MKKLKSALALAIIAGIMVMSSGCLLMLTPKKKSAETTKIKKSGQKADEDDDDEKSGKKGTGGTVTVEKKFGTYTMSEDWVEVPAQSQPPQIFVYCYEGNEDSETPPNNIVVRRGTNEYKKEQHEDFCAAINVQIKNQAAQYDGQGWLESYGEYNGCMVYQFIMDGTPYCSQWYFCGDFEFVMVGMNIYDEKAAEEDHIREVAQQIVESFVWSE